ncbi:MAG: tyrosine--tRNA ligase [Acidobacteriota bacterium]
MSASVSTRSSVLDELAWRGLLYDQTEGLAAHLEAGPVTAYIGFDPTADSLHVGSLLPILHLVRLQRAGHHAIAVVGGGTGMIGDPSGKQKERQLLTTEIVEANIAGIRGQLARFLAFDGVDNPARIVNNADWLLSAQLVDFLRDVGKHFSVNVMLARESVQRRLKGEGISFTEFSYQLLQAWDFQVLHERHGCTLQLGGSDQWGNIVAGIDLIRRMSGGARAYGLVSPLVTTSAGVKFGKTEAGTIWLDPKRTSPYRFYQFWRNTPDSDVARYLRFFTFLDAEAIDDLVAADPGAAQLQLAHEVTAMVHGEDAVTRAVRASELLFSRGGGETDLRDAGLSADDVLAVFDDVPSSRIDASRFDGDGMALAELFALAGVTPSKGAARRLIREGGAYVNNRRLRDEQTAITRDDCLDGTLLILRKGQKHYHLVTLAADDAEVAS